MSQHQRFSYRNRDELEEDIHKLGLNIPLSTDYAILGEHLQLDNRLCIPNRFCVQPMEGFDADDEGRPGELAFRRYQRYARGGSGLIWFEATSVVPEGRSNPGQFYLHPGSVDTFAELVRVCRQTAEEEYGRRPVLILQLTHSGRYSKPAGTPEPIIAHHSPILDPGQNLSDDYPLVTDDYLDELQERFVEAAKLAAAAGFDGVDIKSCHRYLLNELHASFTRTGKYGGSFQNRTRFICETTQRINNEIPQMLVTTRMNVFDAIPYPYGFGVSAEDADQPDLTEPLALIDALRGISGMPLMNISMGNPYYNPHIGRPFDLPADNGAVPDEHPLEGIARFQQLTSRIQNAFPDIAMIGSAYAWLRQFMPEVAAGMLHEGAAALIGQGRGAFAYPDSPRDIFEHGEMAPRKCCITCSACTQLMREGRKTGCVVRDREIYGAKHRS